MAEKNRGILKTSSKIILFFFIWSSFCQSIPALGQQPPAPGAPSGETAAAPSLPSIAPSNPLEGQPTPLPATSVPGKIPEIPPSLIPKLKESLQGLPPGEKPPEFPEKQKAVEGAPAKEIPAPREKSEIEAILSGKISPTVSTDLTQFGYELFQTTVSTFAPVTDVPVGPNYVIGPGWFHYFYLGKV
jgi:hypothetical protein